MNLTGDGNRFGELNYRALLGRLSDGRALKSLRGLDPEIGRHHESFHSPNRSRFGSPKTLTAVESQIIGDL